jgi:hypothetical protein
VQAPVLSQAVAPQVASVVLHEAVQQLPVPAMPQTPDLQASFSVQAMPSLRVAIAMHIPLEHQKPVAQSALRVQLAMQLVALAQVRWFGQAAGVLAVQVPRPLQLLEVSIPRLQLSVPQCVVFGG